MPSDINAEPVAAPTPVLKTDEAIAKKSVDRAGVDWGPNVTFGSQDGATKEDDEWDSPNVQLHKKSTNVDKVIAAAQAFVGTAAETSGFVSGAAAGVVLTTPIPVPFSSLAGGLIGGGVGWWAGHRARGGMSEMEIPGTGIPLTRPNVDAFPPDQRSAAIMGETFGGGLPISAATRQIAKTSFTFGTSFVGNFFNRILKNAADNPRVFASREVSGLTGAATGGVAAQNLDPDDKLSRFAGEVIGGIANPVRLALGFSNKTVSLYQRLKQTLPGSVGAQAKEATASRVIIDMVLEANGDPILLSKLLDANGLRGVGAQTSAVHSGDTTLAELQALLVQDSGKFGAEAARLMQANLDNVDIMLRALRSSGEPDQLKVAAELQASIFNTMIQSRVAAAEKAVMDSVGDISKLGPGARTELSKTAAGIIDEAREMARAAESVLWEKIPGDIRVHADDVVEEYNIILKELGATGEDLPAPIKFFVDKINAAGSDGTVSMLDIVTFRKRALALARDAASGSGSRSASDANMYGRMAEAVLDSLDTSFGARDSAEAGLNRALGLSADAYHAARAYSAEFNKVFTQTFAGHSLRKSAKGTSRVPAEVMLQRALASGGDEGAMRLRELEEATRFIEVKGLADGADANAMIKTMHEAQENLLRILATKYIDPLTKRVSPKSMARFMEDSPELMERFPDVKRDLEKAIKSEVDFQSIFATNSLPGRVPLDATRVGRQQAAFAEVAKLDNSVGAVRDAIRSKNPERALGHLLQLANKGGLHAKEGLRSSVFDHVFDEATRLTGNMDYAKLRAGFFGPLQPGSADTLMGTLRKSGVMDAADEARLVQLLDEADKIVRVGATSPQGATGAINQEMDVVSNLLTRVLGSAASSGAAKWLGVGGQGNSLIIAGAGSQAAQRALDRVPQTAIKDVFIEAATKPKFLAMLLRKPHTPRDVAKHNKQLHAYFIQAGFIPFRGNEEDEELPLSDHP